MFYYFKTQRDYLFGSMTKIKTLDRRHKTSPKKRIQLYHHIRYVHVMDANVVSYADTDDCTATLKASQARSFAPPIRELR